MQRILLLFAFFLLLAGPAAAGEVLINGDFEQPLDVGWTESVANEAGLFYFDRADTFGQPSPGFAGKVYKELARYASLRQTIDVSSIDLTLSFDGRFKIGGGSSTCWPVASLWVRYADSTGLELGNTRICRSSVYSTWTKSDTVSLIEIADTTGAWNNYSLNLKEELNANLPGIDLDGVKKLTIDLYAYDNGTWSGGWAEVSADNISLATTGIDEARTLAVPQAVAAHPNPFTNSTTVRYSSRLSPQDPLRLYDAAGKVVRTQPAGSSCVISGAGLRPGVYVLRAGEQSTRLVKVAD